MSTKQTQETRLQELITISSTPEVSCNKTLKICWNTGEEKNCHSCYLSKGCKARA